MTHLIYVGDSPLDQKLDAATWLYPVKELRKMGWRVTLVTPHPGEIHEICGIEVYSIKRPEIYLVRQIVYNIKLLNFLRSQIKNTDVILFAEASYPLMLFLRLITRYILRLRRPLYAMETRTLPMEPMEYASWKGYLRIAYVLLINQLANRWSDGRITNTKRMAEACKIPEKKFWGNNPSGVQIELFTNVGQTRHWPVSGEAIILIYTGCLHYERNLMALSHAVEKANEEGMLFRLILLGDGREREALEEFAQHTGGRIQIVAPVPLDQVPNWLAKAHVGVLPFPNEEKFRVSTHIKLFEYMAAGMPILATRIDSHTDVIGSGDYVFWAEKSDVEGLLSSIRLVWQSWSTLEAKGKLARIAVEPWTWVESTKMLKNAIEEGLRRYGGLIN